MPVNGRKPFTEIFEVVQHEFVRESASGEESKYMGIVNQVYSNVLPSILPEVHIKKNAFITTVGQYSDGTVTVGSGTSNIIGTSTNWTTAHDNMLFKTNNGNVVYRISYSASTSLTYQNSLTWTDSAGSGLAYKLFQNRYQLPSDFAFMLSDDVDDPHVVFRQVGGSNIFLTPSSDDEFSQQSVSLIGIPYMYCVRWLNETPYLFISMADTTAEILSYSYIPQLTTLSEYTTGTVTFGTGTAVMADAGTTAWSLNLSTANTYYIRNDADGTGSASKWVKISTVGGASTLTLASAWSYTSGANQEYTISEISKWPTRFDDAILYKTAMIVDPDNVQMQKWTSLYTESVGLNKAEEARRKQSTKLKGFFGERQTPDNAN